MRARPRLRSLGAVLAALATHACAPSSSPLAPQAHQVCADASGRRVVDALCRGAAADNPYLWYYFDAGAPVPPLGSRLTGGSLIATNGVAYATSSGDSALATDAGTPSTSSASSAPPQSPSLETVVARDPTGAFVVKGMVNGRPVTFVVDTGASDVLLSPDDAASIGVSLKDLTYDRAYQTANGLGRAASFRADTISVGSITIADVSASINQAPMRYSLLGRAFLDRLNGFRIEHGRLYLR